MVCKQCCGFGVRHVQLLLICFSFSVVHIFRQCPIIAIALAQTEMTDSSSYHEDNFKNTVATWETKDINLLVAMWHYVIPISCFVGGILSNSYNNKYLLLGVIFILSLIAYALPSLVQAKSERVAWVSIFSARTIVGILQGISEPVSYQIIGRWATNKDLCNASLLCVIGTISGNFVLQGAMYFIGRSVMGWASVFYTSGNLGLLWCVAYFTFGSRDFRTCFYISSDEKTYMIHNTSDLDSFDLMPDSGKRPLCWKKIFTSKDVWVILITNFLVQWCKSPILVPRFMLWKFQQYFTDDNGELQLLGIFFYHVVLLVLAVSVGVISDRIVSHEILASSHQRKTCNSIGFWGTAIAMVLYGYSSAYTTRVMASLAIVVCSVFAIVGSDVAYLEMAPNYSGLIYAVVISLTAIPQVMILIITNTFFNDSDPRVFKTKLYLAALLYFFANFIYVGCFSTKTLEWNKAKGVASTMLHSIAI